MLQTDKRLADFADEWWLAEKLPYTVTNDDISMVRVGLLREQSSKANGLT